MPVEIAVTTTALVHHHRPETPPVRAVVPPHTADDTKADTVVETRSIDASVRLAAVRYLSVIHRNVTPDDLNTMAQLLRDPDAKVQDAFLTLVVKVAQRTRDLHDDFRRQVYRLAVDPDAALSVRAKAVTANLSVLVPDELLAREALNSDHLPIRVAAIASVCNRFRQFGEATRTLGVEVAGVVAGTGLEADRFQALKLLTQASSGPPTLA